MNIKILSSYDDIELICGLTDIDKKKPWLVFICPFGLKLQVADAFFEYFKGHFNIVTWESRLILAPSSINVHKSNLSVSQHVKDLLRVINSIAVDSVSLVGYCSGAGIALKAAIETPDLFNNIILVHGEYVMLDDKQCVTQVGNDIDGILPIASMGEKEAQFIIEKVSSRNDDIEFNLSSSIDINLPFKKHYYLHRYGLNYLNYRDENFVLAAEKITQKTFVMTGECDRHTNVKSSMKINETIRNSTFYVDSQADHFGVVRHNSNTLKIIEDYLRTA